MKKYKLNLTLFLFMALIFITIEAKAFWKFPFEIKLGNSASSIENNENYKIRQEAQKVVDSLVSAYESRNISKIMRFISDDYTSAQFDFDDSVRKDFLKYSYIDISVFINNAIKSSDGKIAVSLNYRRTLEDRIAGKIISDNGFTEIILKKEGNVYKLYSMRKPYLFGISGN